MTSQIVKIKTWDDMIKEFGITKNNCINCMNGFMPEMEKELPIDRIITLNSSNFWKGFRISDDMIEKHITLWDDIEFTTLVKGE